MEIPLSLLVVDWPSDVYIENTARKADAGKSKSIKWLRVKRAKFAEWRILWQVYRWKD